MIDRIKVFSLSIRNQFQFDLFTCKPFLLFQSPVLFVLLVSKVGTHSRCKMNFDLRWIIKFNLFLYCNIVVNFCDHPHFPAANHRLTQLFAQAFPVSWLAYLQVTNLSESHFSLSALANSLLLLSTRSQRKRLRMVIYIFNGFYCVPIWNFQTGKSAMKILIEETTWRMTDRIQCDQWCAANHRHPFVLRTIAA